MKYIIKLILLLFVIMSSMPAIAQQKHFIYVESADRQPFAIVMNGKVFSSSDYGYVIIPKLIDGTYNFTISFPMNKFPDQNFKCIINKKDVGYKLENKTDQSWALQNMQTQKFIVGNSGVAEDNAFTNMLSDVVGDSDLTRKNLPGNTYKRDTVAALNIAADTVANSNLKQTSAVNTPDNKPVVNADTQPQKISETKLDTGTNMVFVDRSTGEDTVHVFIPSDVNTNVTSQPKKVTETLNNNVITDTASIASNQSPHALDTTANSANNPFFKANNVSTITAISANQTTTAVTNNAVKQNCSIMVSDNDMDKIRRKMFIQKNDNDMVQTALRYINNKCITTDQIKTLGDLFSSDDGRYNLYDVLYKHAYDYGNYSSLESQIIDPYYKKRFEVMLR